MSEVVYKALFGGITGSAGARDTGGSASKKETAPDLPEQPAAESSKGSGSAVWLIIALVAGLGLFAFLSTGGRGGMNKFKRSFSEMTGGLFGKKPPEDK